MHNNLLNTSSHVPTIIICTAVTPSRDGVTAIDADDYCGYPIVTDNIVLQYFHSVDGAMFLT